MSDKEGDYWTPLNDSEVIWRTMSSVLYWTWEKMQTNWIASSQKKIIGTYEKFLKPKKKEKKKKVEGTVPVILKAWKKKEGLENILKF